MFKFKPFCKAVILLLLLASCNNIYERSASPQLEKLSRDVSTMADSAGILNSNDKEPQQSNTEDYDNIVENGFLAASQNPLSTFSIDVDEAAYSNVRRFIQNGTMPPKGAVRLEEMINYFDYDYAAPQNDDPFTVHKEIAPCPWNEKHRKGNTS
jgi:von Willebrand factor